MSPRRTNIVKDITKLSTFSSFGFIIISNVLVGVIIGAFLDNVFGTKRILLVIFLILGIASGLYNGFKYLLSEIRKLEASGKDQQLQERSTGDDREETGSSERR
ncbi:AtpZ/AtpI family protein [Fervidobacterium thailandense]|uniref:AtpZ/AtpI family protein n=1 Tax=Fervidobacterium thailandense TaxID=1008305 RepID=A0A1E3G4G9_9BACT|nr:AtpZ/AtpI family protein [Fervidobacterium thailandense]ODN31176.1 hypothetical protein A4H02_02655 [Fervidobacterium thailandense]